MAPNKEKTVRVGGSDRQSKEKPLLTVKVSGPGVRTARISVPELMKICQGTQNAITRQAEAISGRNTIHPGPPASDIRQECTLELIGLRKGSTRLDFAIAKPQLPLPFAGVGSFATEVVGELAATIRSLGNGNRKQDIAPSVLQGIVELTDLLGKQGISRIDWEVPQAANKPKLKVAVTATVRDRAAARLRGRVFQRMTVDGVLDMADFNRRDRKCRLDPAVGASVVCTFEEDHEATVLSLLRRPVRVIGEGSIHPYTGRVETVRIESISALPTLSAGNDTFYSTASIYQLAANQGVQPLQSVNSLAGVLTDSETDDFLAAIYEARESL